jgi:hypothetical protein
LHVSEVGVGGWGLGVNPGPLHPAASRRGPPSTGRPVPRAGLGLPGAIQPVDRPGEELRSLRLENALASAGGEGLDRRPEFPARGSSAPESSRATRRPAVLLDRSCHAPAAQGRPRHGPHRRRHDCGRSSVRAGMEPRGANDAAPARGPPPPWKARAAPHAANGLRYVSPKATPRRPNTL